MKGSKRLRADRDGQWQLRVDLPRDPVTGKRRTMTRMFSGTSREADTELAKMVTAAESESLAPTDATLGQLLARWYDQAAPDLSPSTRLSYEWRLPIIQAAIGHVRLSKLTAEHLDRFYHGLSRTGGRQGQGHAPATVRQFHAIIHRALSLGVRWGWVHRNVGEHATLPKANPKVTKLPSVERVQAIIAAAETHPDPNLHPLVRLAAATGARRGELCGLRWEAVGAEGRVVTFDTSIARGSTGLHIKSTKSGRGRTVQLDPGTAAVLAAHRRRQEEFAAAARAPVGPWVFHVDPTSLTPWAPDAVTALWRSLPEAKGVRLHDLRHWSASTLLDNGESLVVVSARVGHSRTSTTADIYAHRPEGADARAALVVGRILDEV